MDLAERLRELYDRLYARYGPQHWWPGDTPLEVMVGAMLTQNTNWGNVAKAIANLKAAGVLSLGKLSRVKRERLAELIRPAGYYNLKAQRLGNLMDFLVRDCRGDLENLWSLPLEQARQSLLGVKGVGPETADSILLYAGGLPVFVIDAYTFRILGRHGLVPEGAGYHELQALFLASLPPDPALFNEYHGLLVRLGKEQCKKSKPLCEGCPAAGL